ncbi:hypothetical protein OG883_24905 [Streptomyces sp. NBC_01142]|uniref:hypothetical protein n=1 Tax=Streptomyces sp. NBC_01142 TaxID=2975865 RepID=UPI00224E1476|nr:hypothetical protein [Streptomyces sp. NBC_01142]MCX4823069.1 hypothetical protein [Streptomyces sp. NBC_01142]
MIFSTRGDALTAATGADTREPMTRMGHSAARAALMQQHATAERERLIGRAVSAVVERARKQDPQPNGHAAGTRAGSKAETHQGQAGG